MTAIETIRHNVRICMFDLYGTVVDIQTGLTRAAATEQEGPVRGQGSSVSAEESGPA
jgi:hypothetical protein